jgi:hypothetical protein
MASGRPIARGMFGEKSFHPYRIFAAHRYLFGAAGGIWTILIQQALARPCFREFAFPQRPENPQNSVNRYILGTVLGRESESCRTLLPFRQGPRPRISNASGNTRVLGAVAFRRFASRAFARSSYSQLPHHLRAQIQKLSQEVFYEYSIRLFSIPSQQTKAHLCSVTTHAAA